MVSHYKIADFVPMAERPPYEEPTLNVPLLVGLLSGVGALLLGLLLAVVWFAVVGQGRIRLGVGEPGEYDDEQHFLEQETEALEHMDELSKSDYLRAKAFIEANPPNSVSSDISLSQFMTIQEKGVSAWEFEPDFPNAECFVEGRTEIEFYDSVCCVQTNLPVPKQNDVYYWEVKIYDKPVNTNVSIGLATKPYPTFRLPGLHRYSVAYDSTGAKRQNQPFTAPHYGPPLQQGDVVGIGFRNRTGTIFFTRNGKKLDDVWHGCRMNMFPTVGANGPAHVVVNFGAAGFVYIEANVKKWGLAPAHGSLAPPPPYGAERDSVLLESGHNTPAPDHDIPPPGIDEGPSTSSRPVNIIVEEETEEEEDAHGGNSDDISLTQLPAVTTSNTTHSNNNNAHSRVASPPPSYFSHDSDSDEEDDNPQDDGEETHLIQHSSDHDSDGDDDEDDDDNSTVVE